MGKKKAKVAVTVLLCIMVAALAGTGVLYLMNNPIEGLDLGFLSKKEDELPAASEDQPMETIEVDPDRFIEGITVSGIDVGGMTMNEARKALFPLRKTLIKSLGYELVYEEKDIKLPGNTKNLGIECNDAYVLNKAFDLGHEEMGEEELQELLNDVKHNGREFEIGLEVNEEELYDKAINDLSSLIDVEVQDATVTLDKEAEDPEKMFMYTNAITGYELDRKAFIEMIKNNLEEEKYSGKIELPVIVTEPKIQDGAPTTEIVKRSSFSTYFGSGHLARNTRVFNIKKAVGFINGTIVAPGETFSTNETIGPRTYALGWQPAPAIVDGGASEDQAGGGVCQVSTTMYNAVVMADLEIVHRQGHSSRISYVDGGLDATINTGTIDFKWKNNTGSNVYVIMYVNDEEKKVYCDIYGEPFKGDFDAITLSSKKLKTLSPSGDVEYRVDNSKPASYKENYASRKDGSVWQSYRNYYKDGQIIKTEPYVKTTYPARNGIVIVGKGYGQPTPTKPASSGTKSPTKEPDKTKEPEKTAEPAPTENSGGGGE